MKKGFTLIELLVVVLIIGILAAIAVPQYQKSVIKSRMAQWDVMFNTAQKAIDIYLLENGFPTYTTLLTGSGGISPITMPGNCSTSPFACLTSVGFLAASCSSSNCIIQIYGGLKADGTEGNTALGNPPPNVTLHYSATKEKFFYAIAQKPACQWVAEKYSHIPAKASVKTTCAGLGVTLSNPTYTE